MRKILASEHGIVCRVPNEKLGYFGWPSVARTDAGALVVASSGLRSRHICPWGKTVLNVSTDEGRTWSAPRVIQNSPLDDRDAGIINLGQGRLLVSWFTSDTRVYTRPERRPPWLDDEELESWQSTLATWDEALMRQWLGSWILLSDDDGATWSAPIHAPVSTPHGPVRLSNGDLLYLGKESRGMREGPILAARSRDGGRTWEVQGRVPVYAGTTDDNYHEPHVVELASGALLGLIRLDHVTEDQRQAGVVTFSLFQTESHDGGLTWSQAKPIGVYGSPPHLLRHSSGALICAYGYRRPGYGQRVMLSYDEGATWDSDWIIRDDGPDGDLGYPCSVELDDGSLFTVYYQKAPADDKCSLLWSRWRMP